VTAAACPPGRVRNNPPRRPELTGQSLNPEQQCHAETGPQPLSLKWVTEDLVAYTQAVWIRQLKREVSREEAIEMLANVKLMAEAFHEAAQKGEKQ
jgi:hypothetical protein